MSVAPQDNPRAVRAALYEYLSRHLGQLDQGRPSAAHLTRQLAPLSAVRIIACLDESPFATWRNLTAAATQQ